MTDDAGRPESASSALAASTGGLPTHDPALEAALRRGLDDVEGLLAKAVSGVHEAFGDASGHLMTAGGKRFRPLLTVLASQLGSGAGPDVIRAAAVVELTHLASLYHDDVMDDAGLRRGTLSANAQFGNTVAILTGDLLFARASSIVAELGPEAVQVQAATFERLVTGQTRETVGPSAGEDPVQHYLGVLADKTGALIATSGRFGAQFAGCPPEVVAVLMDYGERIGVAFQLADDLIDLASESGQSGKTPGTDLREGVPTLPVLLARASADPADAELHELLDGDLTDDDRHAQALALLRVHPSLEQARVQTVAWADAARAALSPLPAGPVRDALDALAEGVVTRDS
jgi:heptaprenyl diphosphate synthase